MKKRKSKKPLRLTKKKLASWKRRGKKRVLAKIFSVEKFKYARTTQTVYQSIYPDDIKRRLSLYIKRETSIFSVGFYFTGVDLKTVQFVDGNPFSHKGFAAWHYQNFEDTLIILYKQIAPSVHILTITFLLKKFNYA